MSTKLRAHWGESQVVLLGGRLGNHGPEGSVLVTQEWSPSHNLKSLKKKQLATREAMARQTVVSDTEQSVVESSVIRCGDSGPWLELALCFPRGTPQQVLSASAQMALRVSLHVWTA